MTELNIDILPPTRAYIDLAALTENYRCLADGASAEAICVVKADCYGHSCRLCVPALYRAGCRHFAVATLAEALEVREILGESPAELLILGYTAPEHAYLLAEHGITQCVFSLEYARALDAAANSAVNIHIKLDTGMNRIGFRAQNDEDTDKTVSEIMAALSLPMLNMTGMFTHFSRADELSDEGDAFTSLQYERFLKIDEKLRSLGVDTGFRHVCNSAGALRFPQFAMDGVRLGILLYGGASHMVKSAPVMRLETKITHIHKLAPGERVGYGGHFVSDNDRTIATLPIGYADGFSRAYTGGDVLLVTKDGCHEARIVGNVCMDQCMIDVTDKGAAVGDRVVLFGDEPSRLERLALRAGTIDYECLCGISQRVPRIAEEDV